MSIVMSIVMSIDKRVESLEWENGSLEARPFEKFEALYMCVCLLELQLNIVLFFYFKSYTIIIITDVNTTPSRNSIIQVGKIIQHARSQKNMCFYTFFPKTRFSSGYQQRCGNIIKESQSHNDSPDKVTIIKDSPDFVETRFSSRRRFSSILESSMMAHAFAVSNPVDPVIM